MLDADTDKGPDGLDCDGGHEPVSPAPRRRVRLRLDLGADSWDEAVRSLEGITLRVAEADARREASIDCTSGSPGAGFRLTGDEDAAVTHESYFEAVDVWLAERECAARGPR